MVTIAQTRLLTTINIRVLLGGGGSTEKPAIHMLRSCNAEFISAASTTARSSEAISSRYAPAPTTTTTTTIALDRQFARLETLPHPAYLLQCRHGATSRLVTDPGLRFTTTTTDTTCFHTTHSKVYSQAHHIPGRPPRQLEGRQSARSQRRASVLVAIVDLPRKNTVLLL